MHNAIDANVIQQIYRIYSSRITVTLSPLNYKPPFPPTPTPILFFVSMSSTSLETSFKWDHTVVVFLCLASFPSMSSRSIHLVRNGGISFFNIIFPCTYTLPFFPSWALSYCCHALILNTCKLQTMLLVLFKHSITF